MWKNILTPVENGMQIKYKNELNEKQFEAVTSTEGVYLVLAGAGSGKTRTLVYRVAYLVEQGIDPSSILLLTFTRKAAQEMLDRADELLSNRVFGICGGTFHSFAVDILRKYGHEIGYKKNFTIQDQSDALRTVKIILAENSLKKSRQFPSAKMLLNIVSKSKNTGKKHEEIVLVDYPQFRQQVEKIEDVVNQYQSYKQQKNLMDFDDLLVGLLQLLNTDECRKKITDPIQYILVDEYQDTNRLQGEITRLLASGSGNLMVVGDDAQSIYSFRGADYRNIMEFTKTFPSAKMIMFDQNYRSTQPILSFSNTILKKARNKYEKELFSEEISGLKPCYIRAKNEDEQAWLICQAIKQLQEDGIKLSEIAILFRASRHPNRLEVKLTMQEIPFIKYGGVKFTELAHIKDIIAVAKISTNVEDQVSWQRILGMFDGLGEKTSDKIYQVIEKQGYQALISSEFSGKKYTLDIQELHQVIQKILGEEASVKNKLQCILDFYWPFFEKKYEGHHHRKKDFTNLLKLAEYCDNLQEFVDNVAINPMDDQDDEQEEKDRLILSTVHSAKGLEWHTVFIIHLVEGCFPSYSSLIDDDLVEEERRLLYVAATRAKKNLVLISPKIGRNESNRESLAKPSRFIIENAEFRQVTEEWEVQSENG